MKYIPLIKIITNVLRTLIFLIILIYSEETIGSINLMTFMSLVTVIGIVVSFGFLDTLVVCSETQLNKYKRFSSIFYALLFLLSFLIILDIKYINTILSGLYFGCIFWSYGEIRRYSPLAYEIILSFLMLVLWFLYLSLFSYETESFSLLTAIFCFFSISLFIFTTYYRFISKNKTGDRNIKDSSFFSTSFSKQGWEFSYSFLSRSPFIIWGSTGLLHPIASYIYFCCELLSAILSHYQTIFVTTENIKKNTIIFKEFFRLLSLGYFLILFGTVFLYFFQSEIVLLLNKFIERESFIDLFVFEEKTALVLLFMSINIFILQIFAFKRYSKKMHDNYYFSLFFLAFSFIYFVIGVFAIKLFPANSLVLSSGLLMILLIFVLFKYQSLKD
jgi:hypothetical protein